MMNKNDSTHPSANPKDCSSADGSGQNTGASRGDRSASSGPANKPGLGPLIWVLLLAWLALVVARGLLGGGYT